MRRHVTQSDAPQEAQKRRVGCDVGAARAARPRHGSSLGSVAVFRRERSVREARRRRLRAAARGRGTGTPSTHRAGRRAADRPAIRRAARDPTRRASAQSAILGSRPRRPRERGSLHDRALEPLLALQHLEPRLSQRVRERAEGVRVERDGRHRTPAFAQIAGGRRSAELLPQSPQLLEQLGAREKASRERGPPPASRRSRCRSARSPSAGARAPLHPARIRASSATGRAGRPPREAPRGSPRPYSADAGRRGTPRARPRRCEAAHACESEVVPSCKKLRAF